MTTPSHFPGVPTIATTPPPPYYAVIFTSVRTAGDHGYAQTADEMVRMGSQQPGFLGIESARGEDGLGITVSYWESLEAIRGWKRVADHVMAQRLGRERWYAAYTTRVARVEYDYDFAAGAGRSAERSAEPEGVR
jgi:heme-degrading monooxygenase HmoA